MAKKIKCQYCGRQYTIQNERDCCPGCGAYNESHLQGANSTKEVIIINNSSKNEIPNEVIENLTQEKFQTPPVVQKNNSGHGLGILKIVLIALAIPFVLFWVLVIISVFVEDANNSYHNDYSYEVDYNYSSSTVGGNDINSSSSQNGVRQEIDWDTGSQYKYGSWEEVFKFFNELDSRRKSEIKTTIRVDGKLEYKDTILYLDNINFSYMHNSSGTSSIFVDVNVENSKAISKLPNVVDFYLVSGTRRDRLTESDGWFLSYGHDDITKIEQVFGIEYTGKTDWMTKVSSLIQYDSLEIEVDGETYSFDLIYDDAETRATYYNYK